MFRTQKSSHTLILGQWSRLRLPLPCPLIENMYFKEFIPSTSRWRMCWYHLKKSTSLLNKTLLVSSLFAVCWKEGEASHRSESSRVQLLSLGTEWQPMMLRVPFPEESGHEMIHVLLHVEDIGRCQMLKKGQVGIFMGPLVNLKVDLFGWNIDFR